MSVDLDAPFNPNNGPCPPKIEFGKFEINTWYSAPYPLEYTRWGLDDYLLACWKSLSVKL